MMTYSPPSFYRAPDTWQELLDTRCGLPRQVPDHLNDVALLPNGMLKIGQHKLCNGNNAALVLGKQLAVTIKKNAKKVPTTHLISLGDAVALESRPQSREKEV